MTFKPMATALLSVILIGSISSLCLAEDGPIATVKTEPLSRHTMVRSLTGFGTVVTGAAQEASIALPRAGQITSLEVMPGQKVRHGDMLFEFSTSPADSLAFEQASSAVTYAQAELQRMQSLFEQNLATNSQLATARKALTDAEAALAEQNRRNSGRSTERVTAPFDGTVTAVSGARGDYLSPGSAVLKLAQPGLTYVQLGIEPEQITRVKLGMDASIMPIFNSSNVVEARVGSVHGIVNPQTRLVDVMLRIDNAKADLPLGTKVRGEILLQSTDVLAVPRSAVLHDNNGAYVFQVDHARAHRVEVVTGMDDGKWVGIRGVLDSKLPIVVVGNYELRDGMAVRESAQ